MSMKYDWPDTSSEAASAAAVHITRRRSGFIADAFLSNFISLRRRGDESLIFQFFKGKVRDSSPRLLLFKRDAKARNAAMRSV